MYERFDTNEEEFDKFMDQVEKRGKEWIWTGTTKKKGNRKTGVFRVKSIRTSIPAPRYMYRYVHGSIPEGKIIIHSCDNSLCVNPAHLKAATSYQNSKDMVQKGRSSMGEKNPSSFLIDEEVINIRNRSEAEGDSFSVKQVAEEYMVSKKTIYDIINWNTWKHLPGYSKWVESMRDRISPDEFHKVVGLIRKTSLKDYIVGTYRPNDFHRPPAAKIDVEDVITITRLRNRGNKYKDIREEYPNLTTSGLRKVATGTTWKNISRTIAEKRTIDNNQAGIRNPNAKLITRQVKRIRRLYREGFRVSKIHAKYPTVSYSQVHNIVRNRTWTHI